MLATLTILASEEPNGNQFPGDVREFYWGTLAFLVVLALIVKYAGPSIKKAFASRTNRIQGEFDDARASRLEAESALSETSSSLPDVDSEAQRIKAEAAATAAKLKTDLVARANEEAAGLKARAISDIENQSRQALADMHREVAGLTRDAAEEVINAELDPAAHAELIDSYINKIGTLR